MQFGMFGRSVGALLAVFVMLAALPAAAAVKQVDRGTAQMGAASRQEAKASGHGKQEPVRASSVMLAWKAYPGAVCYAVRILRGAPGEAMTAVAAMDRIYTTGVHLPLSGYGAPEGLFWSVQPLDYYGTPLAKPSEPQAMPWTEHDPAAPVLTAEFGAMAYAPLYPVYSWIPLAGQMHHEVEVYRRDGTRDTLLHTLRGDAYDVYEDTAFRTPGHYVYRVRGITAGGTPISDWSKDGTFDVVDRTPIAAIGDSITHGGGAITVPPSYLLYDWETYCTVPVKNLGRSGDTTADILARFEHDVLPFAPRVLIIMGGVNDYRSGVYGAESVRRLAALRDKCRAHGITPIFLTATPIRPALMAERMDIMTPPADWWAHRDYINNWVMQQEYSIDVSTVLSDINGELEAAYTTDGLHPDLTGKKYIGQTVDAYLRTHFAYAVSEAEHRVQMVKDGAKTPRRGAEE